METFPLLYDPARSGSLIYWQTCGGIVVAGVLAAVKVGLNATLADVSVADAHEWRVARATAASDDDDTHEWVVGGRGAGGGGYG